MAATLPTGTPAFFLDATNVVMRYGSNIKGCSDINSNSGESED